MEASFGTSFDRVRVHAGDGVAAASGAQALTRGDDVHFAPGHGPEDRFLLGHELAHVVQQRGGTESVQARREGAGERSFLEAEADAAGLAAAAGRPVGPIRGQAGGGILKFDADEHRDMGDAGSGRRTVRLADDYTLTYGQVTALAGDHFESLAQMRAFAEKTSGPESREEIEYALQWKLGEKGRKFSDEAKVEQERRYYRLAGRNDVHFPNPSTGDAARSTADKAHDVDLVGPSWAPTGQTPRNAIAAYRIRHVIAINEALAAGKQNKPIDRAMAADAFASHFLTDSFSGGHIRTERTSIRAYWNAKVPMFYFNFTGFLAEKIAEQLNIEPEPTLGGDGDSLYWLLNEETLVDGPPLIGGGALDTVKAKIGRKGRLDFGDIVALAVHDYDNEEGVEAVVGGKSVMLKGDDQAGHGDEKALAIRAVGLSVADIDAAYALGKAGATGAAGLIGPDGLFAAERLIPTPASGPGKNVANPAVDWQKADVFDLIADPRFQRAAARFCAAKAGEVQLVADEMGGAKKKALEDAIIKKLGDPAECMVILRQVIEWTPDTGGGVFGGDDNNAAAYQDEAARTPGGMQSLTRTARVKLIGDLMSGLKVWDDEEERIWSLLASAPEADARWCIEQLGWDRVADALEGAEDEQFRARFPRAAFGR